MQILRLVFLSVALTAFAKKQEPYLINGVEVNPKDWPAVVLLHFPEGGGREGLCTGTVVGPRTIITAAHCAATGAKGNFTLAGKKYTMAMTRSSKYRATDTTLMTYDLCVGVTSEDIAVTPMSIGGVPAVGGAITILGYGCTTADQSGMDGKLRMGKTQVTALSNGWFETSLSPKGAILCPGDSGGPTLIQTGSTYQLVGVNSQVGLSNRNTISGPSYSARADLPESQTFLKSLNQKICGVTQDCSSQPAPPAPPVPPAPPSPPPAPGAPSCELAAFPKVLNLGDSILFVLQSKNAVSASLLGENVAVPVATKTVKTTSAGSQIAAAAVTAANGKTAGCSATYEVTGTNPAPSGPAYSSPSTFAAPSAARPSGRGFGLVPWWRYLPRCNLGNR